MKAESSKSRVKRQMRRLFQSLDFITEQAASARRASTRRAKQFAEVYQDLAMAWEFLALQCKHWEGYRKAASGHAVCRICGKAKGVEELWLLLPRRGLKIVNHRAVPTSRRVFPNKQAALVLSDTVDFHGARLSVEVHNPYQSRLFGERPVAVSADRMVKLEEGGLECSCYQRLIRLRLGPREPKAPLPFSAFPWELSRKQLKNFPVCLEYDRRRRFVGLTLFRRP